MPAAHLHARGLWVGGEIRIYTQFHAGFPSLVMWFSGTQLLGAPGRGVQGASVPDSL